MYVYTKREGKLGSMYSIVGMYGGREEVRVDEGRKASFTDIQARKDMHTYLHMNE